MLIALVNYEGLYTIFFYYDFIYLFYFILFYWDSHKVGFELKSIVFSLTFIIIFLYIFFILTKFEQNQTFYII